MLTLRCYLWRHAQLDAAAVRLCMAAEAEAARAERAETAERRRLYAMNQHQQVGLHTPIKPLIRPSPTF
eukprot:9371769-Pyramimonas_sp.AAC.1